MYGRSGSQNEHCKGLFVLSYLQRDIQAGRDHISRLEGQCRDQPRSPKIHQAYGSGTGTAENQKAYVIPIRGGGTMNKPINMSVLERTTYFYEWRCPHCAELAVSLNDDRCLQSIQCPRCRNPVYRHGPGEYGTEKPS